MAVAIAAVVAGLALCGDEQRLRHEQQRGEQSQTARGGQHRRECGDAEEKGRVIVSGGGGGGDAEGRGRGREGWLGRGTSAATQSGVSGRQRELEIPLRAKRRTPLLPLASPHCSLPDTLQCGRWALWAVLCEHRVVDAQ